ncbi:PGF-pre-PGF domain-containing protein [Methanolobus vulcani]|uniref:PGF-pre-PGF domain-containing protein n=1 Tax=Methanolobus vulcani TaxID=38026 RepID=A0A7Z8KSN2_9EURY|nr:PGF-pre-PGF domain-containing protein [Methanolobus vulcani]
MIGGTVVKLKIIFIEIMLILALFSIGVANAAGNDFEENDQIDISNIDVSEKVFEKRMESLENLKRALGEGDWNTVSDYDFSSLTDSAILSDTTQISEASSGSSSSDYCVLEGDANLLWTYESSGSYLDIDMYPLNDVDSDGIYDFVVCDEVDGDDKILALSGLDGSTIWSKDSPGNVESVISVNNENDIVVAYHIFNPDLEESYLNVALLSGSDGETIWTKKIEGCDVWAGDDFDCLDSVSDVDGDRTEDIFVEIEIESGDDYDEVSYILSSSDGSILCELPYYVYWEYADFTGDGLTDFVVEDWDTESQSRYIAVIRGTDESVVWESTSNVGVIGIIDVDNDGISELLTFTYEGNLNALRVTDGSVIWSEEFEIDGYPWYITNLKDADGDGFADFALLYEDYYGNVGLQFRSNSDGKSFWDWTSPVATYGIEVGEDIDGDGIEDITCTNSEEVTEDEYLVTMAIFKGNDGRQIFEWSDYVTINSLDSAEGSLEWSYLDTWTWAICDINGDNIIDPVMEIESNLCYLNDETWKYTHFGENFVIAIDGSDSSTIWKFGTGMTNEYTSLWSVLSAYSYLNEDNIVDYLFANNAGAYAIVTTPITDRQPPGASFSADVTSGDVPLEVQFTDTSSGNPTSWSWSFGDGATSTDQNPLHTYDVAGDYTVSLEVTNDYGSDSIVKTNYIHITVPNEAPTATIESILPNPAKSGALVKLIGSGDDTDGSIVAYEWTSSINGDLGDTATLSISSLSIGTHTISFRVQDNDDSWSDIVSAELEILDNSIPTATIISITPNTSVVGESITFSGEGTDADGSVIAYNWTSSIDGQLSTDASFSTSNLPAGEHTIYFKVQDNDYAWSPEASETIIVDDGAPFVNISVGLDSNISVNNPVDIILNSSDMYPLGSEFLIVNSSGDIVFTEDLTESIISGGYNLTLTWNASNQSGEPVPSGDYTMVLTSFDEFGHLASEEKDVVVDNTAPIIDIDDIFGYFTQEGDYAYSNSSLTVNTSTSEDVNSVDYFLNPTSSDYDEISGISAGKSAEFINNNWTATFNLSSLSEGIYNLTVTATDAASNINSTMSDIQVVIDHTSPVFSSITSQCNDTYRNVSVSVSENITGNPIVEVNSELISVYQNGSKWTGCFPLDNENLFYVNVTGTDLAGNTGESTSILYIETVTYENGTGIFNSSEFGMSITFDGTNNTTGNIIVTESTVPMENLTDGSIGLYFFNVELDVSLAENMSGAKISIPTDSVDLPDGMTEDDVVIRYYNETTGYWDNCTTSIETINGKNYWTAYVSHFSTYGITGTYPDDVVDNDSGDDDGDNKRSSSGGSSGGSGGGGTTGEKYENIFVKDVLSIFINKDSHINYEFTKEGNAITSVQFDSLKNSGTISTIVEVLNDRSSFADVDAPGTVYQQMNIWVGKSGFVTPDNVENLLITFKVEKSWLEENNIEASTVSLYRYSDGSWNALPTSVTEEDNEFVSLESETPGFSPFAIGSEAEVIETVEEDSLMSVDDTIAEDIDTEEEPESSSSSTGILAVLGGVSVLLVGAFVAYNKRS